MPWVRGQAPAPDYELARQRAAVAAFFASRGVALRPAKASRLGGQNSRLGVPPGGGWPCRGGAGC